MQPIPRVLLNYITKDGRCPFGEWLNALRDVTARAQIRKRLNRMRIGNLGNNRYLGDGIWELKIDFGPGYRIYYGEEGNNIVVLLIGGDKSSQNRDIQKAKQYWEDYHA